jgi:hypothetical protein
MGLIRDQIRDELKLKIREQMAQKQQQALPPKKTVGGFISNIGKNITNLAKGIVGLGYQGVRHPIESGKNIVSAGIELGKQTPKASIGLAEQMAKTIIHPIQTVKQFSSDYRKVKEIPYEEQKKMFDDITSKFINEDERGKRILGVLGSGLLGATTQEITHPAKYAYENPVNFALDVLSAGQATGANKLVSGAIKSSMSNIPAVVKVQTALKEVFTPNGRLVTGGFKDLANDLTKTKSEIFKVQKQIVEDTSNKFYKEFKLNPKEQTEFFETIDKLRRTKPLEDGEQIVKATSVNPKIQKAISWWLDEEAPKLAQASGLPAENAIQNYLHHFFPEKFKTKEVALTKPLQYSKKSYLKKSADVEGFTKDPVLSISAIKSRVAVDNLRDGFIKNTIDKYAVKTDTLATQLTNAGVDITGLDKTALIEKAKQILNLEEYKPKGNLKFFKVKTTPAEDILKQINLQGFRNTISAPQLLEQSFVKVGRAIQLAEESGLNVSKLMRARTVGGRAMLGGIENGGTVKLRVFTSDVVSHELGHSFDVSLSKVINTKKIYQKELKNLVDFTKLGGSSSYKNSAVERFAEFTDLYIHNPGKAKELAPTFAKYFEKELLPNQKIGELVDKLSDFYQKVDNLPNIKTPLKELDNSNYLETTIRKAFPSKSFMGVSKNVETHLLPKVIAEELNKFTTGGKSTLEKLFLPFDVFNRNWKPLATAVRPRYHTRNVLGNIYNSTIVAGNNPISFILKDMPIAAYQQIKSVISTEIKNQSLLGKVYKSFFGNVLDPDILKQAVDNDVIGRGFFGADVSDLTTAVNKGDDIMKTIKNINTPAEIYKVPVLKQWLQLSTKVGQFLEDNARLALFKQGLKKFAGNADEAKNYVNKHLFDYLTGLGEADRIIKRFIPFWSWTRFNIPLQATSLLKTPLRYLAIQKGTEPYRKQVEMTDEGYQYLTPEQQDAGLIKVGTTEKGGKEYDKYIKTASVLPLDDLSRLVDILRGKDEEIGITPLKQIYDLITKDPTKFKNYFGQPIEQFAGEKKKFLGVGISGKTKELLSTIPLLTEINKLIGGGYAKEEKPKTIVRVEQVLSPLGVSLVDRESNKFFSQLEKEKELTGSYTSGLQQIYKKYLKLDMERKGSEKYISDNIKLLEVILKQKGLNELDLFKIKNSAIKALLQDAFKLK